MRIIKSGVPSRTARSTWSDLMGAGSTFLEGFANPESFIRELLEKAGIEIGGSAAHDIVINDRRFFARVARDGALGLGESYVDGWWDSPAVDEMITRIHRANLPDYIRKNWKYMAGLLKTRVLNLQSRKRSFEAGERSEEHTSELQSRQYLVCRLL